MGRCRPRANCQQRLPLQVRQCPGGSLINELKLIGSYHFAGELEIGGQISDNTFTAFETSSLTFDPLTFTATGFDVSGEEAEIVVTPVSTLLNCQ